MTNKYDTPPVADLLAHWREVTARGQTIAWGEDRAAAILDYIDELETDTVRKTETIVWNRQRHAAEVAELRLQIRQ